MTNDWLPPDPMKDFQRAMKALQFQDSMKDLFDAMRFQDPMMKALEAIGFKDSIKSTLDAMNFQDPLKKTLESITYQDSTKDALDAMNSQEPLKKALESMKYQDSIKDALDAMNFRDPLKKALESMKYQDSIVEALGAMNFYDPIKEAFEGMKYQDSMKVALDSMKFQDPMKGYLDAFSALNIVEILDSISKEKWPLAYEPSPPDLIIVGDTITLGSESVSQVEIQKIADQIAEKVFDKKYQHLEQLIDRLAVEIRALKNPMLEKILTLFVFPLVLALVFSLVNPTTDFYIKEKLTENKRQVEKEIKKRIVESVGDARKLEDYRLVTASELNVRHNPSAKSPAIGTLRFGNVVRLIEKNGDWSLVMHEDAESKVQLQGWVFSRYVKKLL